MIGSTALTLSTEVAEVEIRCPHPHPRNPSEACGRLLLCYRPPTVGTVAMRCQRCKAVTTLAIRST